MTPVDDLPGALVRLLGSDFEPYVDNFPTVLAQELLANDQGFIRRSQMTVDVAKRFRPQHRNLPSPDVLRAILAETGFAPTRMQPLYGNLGYVRSTVQPGYGHYPYVPLNFMLAPKPSATLVVAIHGSSRNAKDHRDAFSDWAERHGCFVLAPLFPIEMDLALPDEEYKYVAGSRTRYDQVLFDMIDEFSAIVGVKFDRVFYFGFSGGGQFCHRMFYAHPEKMDLVAAAAPGFVTLPDPGKDWWVGIRDLETRFGKQLNVSAMAETPLLLLCGTSDTIPFEIYSAAEMGLSAEEYQAYGPDRMTRIMNLEKGYRDLGVPVELQVISDCPHDFRGPMHDAVRAFMEKHL